MDIFDRYSDTEDYTETSDSDEQDVSESIFGAHAQDILWSLDESIGKIDDFLAFERGFSLGDVVSSANNPSGQLGRVVNVHMVVDLETGSGKIVRNVDSRRLSRLRSFVAGDYVVMGPWIGKVMTVVDAVTVLFSDGSKNEVLINNSETLVPIPPILFEDAPNFYCPGQRVKVNIPGISRPARWLCGSWRTSRDDGIVCDVKAGLVQVNWILSVTKLRVPGTKPPSDLQEPKELTLLSSFPHASWQMGDICTLSKGCSQNHVVATLVNSCLKTQTSAHDPDGSQIYIVARTRSKVDVLWQDGIVSVDQDPKTLVSVSNLGGHDFWPGQFVVEDVTTEDDNVHKLCQTGLVQAVDALEKTVKIKWLDMDPVLEETISAYGIVEHQDFSYCIGEIVVQSHLNLDKSKANDTGARVHGFSNDILECSAQGKVTGEGFLSCFGTVIGYKDEGIEVKWADGLVSKVHPSEIISLEKFIKNASESVSISDVPPSADHSVEVVNREKPHHDNIKKLSEDSMIQLLHEDSATPLRLLPRAALDFISAVAANIFGFEGSASSSSVREGHNYEITESDVPKFGDLSSELLSQPASEVPAHPDLAVRLLKFKKFDILDSCPDHHFTNQIPIGNSKRSWFKRIQQEWNNLESNLPDSIFVRVFEERVDLLRACIVGVSGTPYHNGLFFFDIFFPPEYPHEPPQVHYISGGLRLNPNLYESGKVCLSLLKTWAGVGSEVWNPDGSNVLQVLLSLQALVLNERPYFNEAGYDKQVGRHDGEKNSVTYNENAFLLSCKSMMYILRKPPKHFEQLVEEHFTARSSDILDACKEYLKGAPVGHTHDHHVASTEHGGGSTGFKIMLDKLLPKLVSALKDAGITSAEDTRG